jgi:glycosyltransferase involved in cell wall biosynthesis
MKILFIVDYYYPYIGGAEVVHQKLAELLALKHDVTVLTQASSNAKLEESINNVKVIRVKTINRLTFPWQAQKIAYELAAQSDIIQVSTYSSGFLGGKIRKKLSRKVILLVHGYLREVWYQLRLTWTIAILCHWYETRLFSKKFDYYVVPSCFTQSNLLKLGIDKDSINVIHHGIDTDLFHPRPQNISLRDKLGISSSEQVFLFAGRPSRMKGIETLLEAFQHISAPIRLVLMLAKDSRLEYERVIKFIEQNELTNRVLVIDPVVHTQMPDYLSMANVVLIPSLTEEFCFLAAETAAMNIPMVVTNVGAIPEVVSGKVLFVEPGSVDDLIKGIEMAINNQFTVIERKEWGWQRALLQYEQLYARILNTTQK